ncbi:MAG: hypothetical protein KDC98_19320 [Planctomycetes bacterium]|nr:hypothetical protein [Planctomycetota bacterium]
MESRTTIIAWLVLALALAVALPAQDGFRRFSPDKLERKTEKGEDGMIKWAKHDAGKCPTCAGTGKAPCKVCERFQDDASNCPDCKRAKDRLVVCRTCIGTGGFPDPLEKVQCPTCMAAGFLLCTVCGGGGQLKVDKAKRWSACPACRGDGGFKCATCNGERHVASGESLKPSLAEADSKKLTKAIETTNKLLTDLAAFKPKGGPKVRKEVKELAKLLKDGKSVHPSFKAAEKVLGDYMGKAYAGSSFIGHEEQELSALTWVRTGVEYYLQHQKRIYELALQRAEANEKLEAEQKGK